MSDTFAKSSNAPSFWETVRNGSNDEMVSNIGVVIEEYIEPTPGQSMFEQRVAVQNLPRVGTTNTLGEHTNIVTTVPQQQHTILLKSDFDKTVAIASSELPKNKRKCDDGAGTVDYDSLDDFDFGDDGFDSSSSEYSAESYISVRRSHSISEEDEVVSVTKKKLNTTKVLVESTQPQQKNQQPTAPPQHPIKSPDLLQNVQNVDLYDIPTLPILPYHNKKFQQILTVKTQFC